MPRPSSTLDVPVRKGRDHIRGPEAAPVTLLEYGDFACPRCGVAAVIVDEIGRRMGHQLRFVYRHFPIVEIHPHAERAAEAAEAAGSQGDFWPMHDLLFLRQKMLDDDDLLLDAADLGFEIARFAEELASRSHRIRVRQEVVSGIRSGVRATPTFFVNDVRLGGGHDAASLMSAATRSAARHPWTR
jgi:protein-disulfide isomerase